MSDKPCSLDAIQQRANLYRTLRKFFDDKGVLEVETPILSKAGATDVYLASITAAYHLDGRPCTGYLQTSPEFAMKRLLANGSGAIYQICKVFRDNEQGDKHNSEFTMLEWYRPDMSLEELMAETNELICTCLEKKFPIHKITYKNAFYDKLGINPLKVDIHLLKQTAFHHNINIDLGNDRLGYMDLLFSHCVEPFLGIDEPVFLTDFPKQLASLAKMHRDDDGDEVASRFELYIDGLELANAYDELNDKGELLNRFNSDNRQRQMMGLPMIPIDERLLQVIDHLPECSGIALGVDRLLMVLMNVQKIEQVMTFTADKA